jgi:hypothetical protein
VAADFKWKERGKLKKLDSFNQSGRITGLFYLKKNKKQKRYWS